MEIMLLKKRAEFVIAYCILATATVIIVADDTRSRRAPEKPTFNVAEVRAQRAPFPMTPLADSPFLQPAPGESRREILANANRESGPAHPGARHSAPFGIYFLRVAIQTESDEGPVTFAPGTQVRLMRHQSGKMRVTRDGTDFLVEESQLTNDLDTVAVLAGTSS